MSTTVDAVGATEHRFRNGHLVVHQVGAGDTVGYLHGMIGNPGVHPFLTALAGRGRRVVAPSLPGFTGSPPCEDLRTLHDWVVAASEVLDVAGITGRTCVASSVGAMLALEVACVRPEAFERLVLVAPFGLWDPADPVVDPFGTTLSTQREMLTADPARTAAFFEAKAGATPEELVDADVERYHTRTAAASLIWPLPEFGLSTRAHRVRCPVTLVWGGADRINPVSYLHRFAGLLPNVVGTHVVDGAGHLAEWDAPVEVAAVVG